MAIFVPTGRLSGPSDLLGYWTRNATKTEDRNKPQIDRGSYRFVLHAATQEMTENIKTYTWVMYIGNSSWFQKYE